VKVLVVGSGAREHAIVRALLRDPSVTSVAAAPGNAGIADDAAVYAVVATEAAEVVALAQQLNVDLVVIGPEAPLVLGVADAVRAAGIACFGPSAAAARLEGSKAFAKEVMAAAGVPTAAAAVCTNSDDVVAAFEKFGPPYVVKDDGLAAGKGVVVTNDRATALTHAMTCFERLGGRVVVEEFLDGPEISLFLVTDGVTVLPLQPAQDFKRLGDGDTGPNTGGMGAYSPLPWAPDGLVDVVVEAIAQPVIDELARRGTPFSGLLYAGLALTNRGLRVVEFNARFGDPETQVVLTRLRTPLGGLLYAAATGDLAEHMPLVWSGEAAITVVIAAENYPGTPVTGGVITGLDAANEVPYASVLHGGTRRDREGNYVSSGGRVLSVTATGATISQARLHAYEALGKIELAGSQYRSDIAAKL